MKHQYSAILFDLDGVIVDSMGAHAQAWVTACSLLGIDVTEEEIYRREGEMPEKSARQIIKAAGMMSTKARIAHLIRLKEKEFAGIYTDPRLFPGAYETVFAFTDAGFKAGIVTGTLRQAFDRILDESIRALLSVSICGDEVLRGKPNPEPYLKGIMALGKKPEETVVVENAPFGIESAKNAGAYVVAVRSYLGDKDLSEADVMVDDIRKIPALFGL